MRIASDCDQCNGGKAKVYATIRGAEYVTRYRRCDRCGELSKTMQKKISSLSLSSNKPIGFTHDIATIESSVSITHTAHGE
jgi:hypothetical protein